LYWYNQNIDLAFSNYNLEIYEFENHLHKDVMHSLQLVYLITNLYSLDEICDWFDEILQVPMSYQKILQMICNDCRDIYPNLKQTIALKIESKDNMYMFIKEKLDSLASLS
jgi:hypothetical protein